jgi:hypothetical protein
VPEDIQSAATRLLDAHPRLREHMGRSRRFAELEAANRLEIDGGVHYVVRGDTLGGLDDLYVDALVRGASPHADELSRALFEELDDELKQLIKGRSRTR